MIRQQPVAGDLRFIAGSFKILTKLDRIADVAVVLAERAVRGGGVGDPPVDLTPMAAESRTLVEDAKPSRVVEPESDPERAAETRMRARRSPM